MHRSKEGNVLFNDALKTFYLRLYGVRHMVKDHSDSEREETRCRHVGYVFRLAARVHLHALSYRHDSSYHGVCYITRGALDGMRNSSMGPSCGIDPMTHHTMSKHSYTELHAAITKTVVWVILSGMVPTKEPLLLIGKNNSLVAVSFLSLSLSEWSFTICPTPYNRK